MWLRISAVVAITAAVPAIAQDAGHGHMEGGHAEMAMHGLPAPSEPGQGAFAAIAEIVSLLEADPETDWARVDIEALRQHLIDMDNVTLRAEVVTEDVEGGARFLATSDDPTVAASIRRMTTAHATTMDGVDGRAYVAEGIDGGAALTATGDPVRIRALGFIGVLSLGMHHQAHHLAIAKGAMPH